MNSERERERVLKEKETCLLVLNSVISLTFENLWQAGADAKVGVLDRESCSHLQDGDNERSLKAVRYVNTQWEKGGGLPPRHGFADFEHEAGKEGGGEVEEEESPHHGYGSDVSSEPKTFVWMTQNSKAKPYPFDVLNTPRFSLN